MNSGKNSKVFKINEGHHSKSMNLSHSVLASVVYKPPAHKIHDRGMNWNSECGFVVFASKHSCLNSILWLCHAIKNVCCTSQRHSWYYTLILTSKYGCLWVPLYRVLAKGWASSETLLRSSLLCAGTSQQWRDMQTSSVNIFCLGCGPIPVA